MPRGSPEPTRRSKRASRAGGSRSRSPERLRQRHQHRLGPGDQGVLLGQPGMASVGNVAVPAEDHRHDVLVRRLRQAHHLPHLDHDGVRPALRRELARERTDRRRNRTGLHVLHKSRVGQLHVSDRHPVDRDPHHASSGHEANGPWRDDRGRIRLDRPRAGAARSRSGSRLSGWRDSRLARQQPPRARAGRAPARRGRAAASAPPARPAPRRGRPGRPGRRLPHRTAQPRRERTWR